MSKKEEHLIEAILFAAGNRIAVARVAELAELSEKKVLTALQNIQKKYEQMDTPFEILNMDDDWKFTVKRTFIPTVEKIAPDTELAKPIVETLAILAWKAPVLQSELIKIRGTSAYDHIGELMERALISKQRDGRSYQISLTPKFYEYFDIDKGRIKKEMDAFEGADEVKEEHIQEVILKEDSERQARLDSLEGQPTLDEIRAEEHKDQGEFFDKMETEIAEVTRRSDKIISEMQDIVPTERDESIPVGEHPDEEDALEGEVDTEESAEVVEQTSEPVTESDVIVESREATKKTE